MGLQPIERRSVVIEDDETVPDGLVTSAVQRREAPEELDRHVLQTEVGHHQQLGRGLPRQPLELGLDDRADIGVARDVDDPGQRDIGAHDRRGAISVEVVMGDLRDGHVAFQ